MATDLLCVMDDRLVADGYHESLGKMSGGGRIESMRDE